MVIPIPARLHAGPSTTSGGDHHWWDLRKIKSLTFSLSVYMGVQSDQFKKYSKTLIGWKKAGPLKKPLLF